MSFLGHTLSKGVILPRQETVDKILHVPPPRTLKQFRSFLGLASYYRKYVPDFAVVRKKGQATDITWDEVRDQAFQELKKRISEPPILRLPGQNRVVV